MAEYELWHYGVKGMKWGVRRFQKKDGTLTSAGKKKYQGSWGDIEKQFNPGNEKEMDRFVDEAATKSGMYSYGIINGDGLRGVKTWSDAEIKRLGRSLNNREVNKKYISELKERIAGATLQDLGYNNTEKGRKFLLDNMLILY
nr:MAG TPA: hypothetical protein [Caudoviricetes sp.]